MSGEQLAKGPLNNVFWVYLGGVPTKFFSHEVPISEGFVGCMQNLAVSHFGLCIQKPDVEIALLFHKTTSYINCIH